MNDYVSWLNGVSIARGTKSYVEKMARKVFETTNYQEFEASKGPVSLKITRGAKQLFVKSIILEDKQ